MKILSSEQRREFWDTGVLTIENAVTEKQLAGLQKTFQSWVEESRAHTGAYGKMLDGRPRFDVEPGHSADRPALRRVNAPGDVSEEYWNVIDDSIMTDAVCDLIGPDVKHHHNKINSKLPGAATAVKWHQDFPFTPHTNFDLITALLMVDEVTQENGPLQVVPGSHKGPLYDLWHGDVFTGAVSPGTVAELEKGAQTCTGSAGSVCLMHTCLAHASAPNLSGDPRTLFIVVYSAGDAVACSPNPVPNSKDGVFVRGSAPGRVRSLDYDLRLPEMPRSASFFTQQA